MKKGINHVLMYNLFICKLLKHILTKLYETAADELISMVNSLFENENVSVNEMKET